MRTEYRGPVVVTSMNVAGRTIRLVRPADPDQLLDDPLVIDWNRHDDYMPYWAYLWPAAYLLAEAVAREPWPARTRESAASRRSKSAAVSVWPAWLPWHAACECSSPITTRLPWISSCGARPKMDLIRARFSTRQLDWRDLPDERYSIILGADVIYEARLVPLVAGLLGRLLAPGGVGLLASPYRVAAKGFPAALAEVGLVCQAEAATARTEDGQLIEGTIYRVTRSTARVNRDSTGACR